MHAVEDFKNQSLQYAPGPLIDEVQSGCHRRVLIVDAMAVLQGMKKTPNMKALSVLQDAFIKRIEWMMIGCTKGCVVFDRYIDQSLKAKTRQWRAVTSVEYLPYPEMKLTISLKELLSSSKTESSLTSMIGKGVL